ncbi:1-deoxy-D-xylulose-5-phosphate synthase [Clostridium sp. AM32-2]|nr:1-deoxy-D-xylulose-5-phosphate synthase [Clostridium sp. AM32-2]RHT25120.1 1-deoxy-D-xylulose-5-phosphate synthase [Clostridium sp. AM32-2]
MILEQIKGPEDLKKLTSEELSQLAEEIRAFLIEKISHTGGHLASNLGVVELTIALFRTFDLPEDKIIWDVGHQSYTHKILSGRRMEFDELRQYGGLSGFPKRKESPYDSFDTGHSSTSISAGLGIAQGRDILGEDYKVVSVIGDGALTGGMAYEALNNAARMKKNFIIILNDNKMSISENVGGMSRYLGGLRTGAGYNDLKKNVADTLERIPVVGGRMIDKIKRTKNSIKQLFIPGMLFENMGITYLGPVDGHNIPALCKVLKEAQKLDHAVLVHVLTKKGKGYEPAEKNPAHFHGVSPFDIKTGKPLAEKKYPTYTDVFSKKLCQLGETHPELVAVTAAMPDGTGVAAFGKKFPDRFFDVGIAEAHAVTSAAGMAAAGLRPVVAVYSSFLQRGYDQILHDVCIQNLPVLFAVDRAGLVGSDGETHQGIFDYSYLTSIPNMSVAAPKNLWELRAMLDFAMDYKAPFAIRYPRGTAYRGLKEFMQPIAYGKGEIIYEEENIALLAVGSMVSTGEHVREKLKEEGVSCTLANARFVKPFDKELVDRLSKNHRLIVTMEENVLQGGFGLPVTAYIHEHYPQVKVMNIALPDAYVEHGNVSVLRKGLGIDSDSIIQRLKAEGWL